MTPTSGIEFLDWLLIAPAIIAMLAKRLRIPYTVAVRCTFRKTATSSLKEVNGICAATTLNPRLCYCSVTLFQLEPSAHAACTNTTVPSVFALVMMFFFPL